MHPPSPQLLRILRTITITSPIRPNPQSCSSSSPGRFRLLSLQPPTAPGRCISTTFPPHFPSRQTATASTSSSSSSSDIAAPKTKIGTKSRGLKSSEETQTDFSNLNVLGNLPPPTTAIDACMDDGFQLDNGVRVLGGDGVLLVSGEAFRWRPWEGFETSTTKTTKTTTPRPPNASSSPLSSSSSSRLTGVRRSGEEVFRDDYDDGGNDNETSQVQMKRQQMVNSKGQFDVEDVAWGVLEMVWPKPDLLILGLGANMMPISPRTRKAINDLGIRVEVQDTRNAAAQFNLLATERGTSNVAAALVPIGWKGS